MSTTTEKNSRYRGEVSNAMEVKSIDRASLYLAEICRILFVDTLVFSSSNATAHSSSVEPADFLSAFWQFHAIASSSA
jgi:hypothetical protein